MFQVSMKSLIWNWLQVILAIALKSWIMSLCITLHHSMSQEELFSQHYSSFEMIKYQFSAPFMSPQWHGAGYPSNLSYTLFGSLYADLFYSLQQYIKMSHRRSQAELNLPVVDPLTTLFYKYPSSSCHKPQKPCLCLVLAFTCHAPPQIVACPPLPISSQPQLPLQHWTKN